MKLLPKIIPNKLVLLRVPNRQTAHCKPQLGVYLLQNLKQLVFKSVDVKSGRQRDFFFSVTRLGFANVANRFFLYFALFASCFSVLRDFDVVLNLFVRFARSNFRVFLIYVLSFKVNFVVFAFLFVFPVTKTRLFSSSVQLQIS